MAVGRYEIGILLIAAEGQSASHRWQEVHPVKIESVREVRAKLNRLISELPKTGSVVMTKNRKPCAALMPITEDTDLKTVALAQNKRFCRSSRSFLESQTRR